MLEAASRGQLTRLVTKEGRPVRVAHLTTVDMSLALLLGTELAFDVEAGLDTYGLSAPGPYLEQIRATGAKFLPVSSLTRAWNPRRDLAAARELAAALRRLRPDVLHTHNPKTGVLGRVVGRGVGVPVIVNTCHGLWASPEDRLRKRVAVYAAEVAAALGSDGELYQNAADRATLRRWIRQGKVEVVGNGTDLEQFRPDPGARTRVRAQLGVTEDTLLVGGVGRLVEEKGIREFTEMARRLAGRARFVWVGPADPEKRDALTDVTDVVDFLGNRSDMPAVYNALDVFVLPSYREGFSRSAMEAAACRTAMVLSDIRGCREIGGHESEVLLAPARDHAALVQEVARLLDDADLRERLADGARRRALARFDQREVAAASIRTYLRVAQEKRLGWRYEDQTP